MKKIIPLQILMLMTLVVGASNISADAYSKSYKKGKAYNGSAHKKSYEPNISMDENERMAMQELVSSSQLRIKEEMGEFPTELSIKKFIHAVVEEFKQSSRNEQAVEKAYFKLYDAQVATRHFTEKLESLDKHGIAETHIRSLKRKLRDARHFVKEHANNDDMLSKNMDVAEVSEMSSMPNSVDANEVQAESQEEPMLDDEALDVDELLIAEDL